MTDSPIAVFDDFCTWAGAGLQLWTQDTYYTNDYYCRDSWDPDVCIHLQVQYEGHAANGDGNAGVMDYNGCKVCMHAPHEQLVPRHNWIDRS